MQYNVSFGSAFAVDQFGFVRKGTVTTGGDTVVFAGKKSWSTMAKLGIFLAITILPLVLFGFGLGFLLALVVIHYLCASDGTISIAKSTITEVQRNGKQIKFKGQHPNSGKTKKTVFKVDTEENAQSLENEMKA
jgi:hypothetical protein